MGGESTVLLNASYEVLDEVSWQRAIALVLAGEAEVFEADETKLIRSQHLTLPFPKVIRLVRYVYVKFVSKVHKTVSKKAILARDKHTCAYCGKSAKTVDHVLPKSRGGKDTFENLVAACFKCNNKKDNRTPEEAHMKLLWEPWNPSKVPQQRAYWSGPALAPA